MGARVPRSMVRPSFADRRPQHAHGIFAIALARVADHAQHARFEVFHAAAVVEDLLGARIVVERIHGEIAAQRILGLGAEHVVAQQATVLVLHLIVVTRALERTEGRDLDGVLPAHAVHDAEAAADHARAAERTLHLFRRGIGGHIEVLRLEIEQQVAHRAAHDVGTKAVGLQALGDAPRAGADAVPRHAVLVDADTHGLAANPTGLPGTAAGAAGKHLVEQLLDH
jgi:hypothetical protein